MSSLRKFVHAILAGLVALVFLVVQDIRLWATIFEADELWQYIGVYHRGWFVMLWGAIALFFVLWWRERRMAIVASAFLWTTFFGGGTDLLYYWLQLIRPPTELPWLDQHPLIFFSPVTEVSLIMSVVIWLIIWLFLGGIIEATDWMNPPKKMQLANPIEAIPIT